MATFRTWTREFVQWIKHFFGGADQHRPTIVADEYNAFAALYRINDEDIPGCVELWKVVRRKSTSDLVLILLDRALLREQLGASNSGKRTRHEPWQTKLSRRLATELKTQGNVDGSHVIVVLRLHDRTGIDTKGRSYRMPVANLVGSWVADLQGGIGTLYGNRYASHILKMVAYRIFKAEVKKGDWEEVKTWEEFVDSVPWLEWLDEIAKHYLGHDHVLQPPKRKAALLR